MLSARMNPAHLAQAEVVKNRIKAMSLTRGDVTAIARWQMADGKTARWSDRDSDLRSKKALGRKDPLGSRYSSRTPSIQRRSLALMFSASRCVDTFVLLPNGIFRESSLFARGTQLRLAHANTATKVILNAAI
jgi:hypothetical protein